MAALALEVTAAEEGCGAAEAAGAAGSAFGAGAGGSAACAAAATMGQLAVVDCGTGHDDAACTAGGGSGAAGAAGAGAEAGPAAGVAAGACAGVAPVSSLIGIMAAAMEKLPVRRQIVGPLLREVGEAFGPGQRRHAHTPPN